MRAASSVTRLVPAAILALALAACAGGWRFETARAAAGVREDEFFVLRHGETRRLARR